MTERTKILGKSYDNADFQNFLRKSSEKVKKNLRSQLSYLKLAIRSTNTNKYLILRKTRTKQEIN